MKGGGLERRLIEVMNYWKMFMQRRMKSGKRSYDLDRILETGLIGRWLRSLVCVDTVLSLPASCCLD